MWTVHILIITCAFIFGTQAVSILDRTKRSPSDDGMWRPSDGNSRDEWLRCHGFSCDTWEDTRMKLQTLKMMTARTSAAMELLVNDTDDSLDNCIWLTGEQLDEIFSEMEENLQNPAHSGGYIDRRATNSHGRYKRKVTDFKKYSFSMWPKKTVHWKFDGAHNEEERSIIRGAFSHWQEQTCMRFKELGTQEQYSDNHILVTRENTGCHSFIGRITTIPQQLNLQRECLYNLGTPVHEIGHALGLWHEQQRSDRDEAIRILWDNLGYYVGQFYKQSTDNLTPYDYGSVMHYAPKDGSTNGKNTMETLNPLYQHNIGQRTGLSFLDVKAINLAYCQDACSFPLSGCQHGGYQDPNDCSRCKCPDGLGGVYCDKVAPAENAVCGGELTLSSTPLYIESPGYKQGPYRNHITCSWRIKAPKGSRISLKFEGDFAIYAYYQQQCHHWVEVRYKKDIGAQGPRFCGYHRPSDTVLSESEEMLIVFKTNWTDDGIYSRLGFKAKLEKVDLGLPPTPTSTTIKTTTNSASVSETTAKTTATTATSTTTAAPLTTTTMNSGCEMADLMILMDSSGGVMEQNWYKILHFANNIVSQFEISPQGVHVGVITYASHAEVSLSLDSQRSLNEVTDAIDAIPFLGGATNTHTGFLMMRAQFSMSSRPNVRKIAILITDGQTAMPNLAIQQASYLRSEGIQLYVAGVDKNFDYIEATKMVIDVDNIIQIESFDDMVSPILNYGLAIKEKICGAETTATSSHLSWSCDFEDDDHPFCDMIQDKNTDQFDWTWQSGKTPSGFTGPDRAYSGKYYIYIEASDPRKPGDEAIIYLPDFRAEGKHCLSFAYSMYGFHIRTLQLAKKTHSGAIVPLWLLTGEQGKNWQTATVSVNLQVDDQIMIIAKRGNAYSGDIALDNLRITAGQCLKQSGSDVDISASGSPSYLHHEGNGIITYLTLFLFWIMAVRFA